MITAKRGKVKKGKVNPYCESSLSKNIFLLSILVDNISPVSFHTLLGSWTTMSVILRLDMPYNLVIK